MLVKGKNHVRIALENMNNPMQFVHNDFHIILLLDERKIPFSDPPFLNRFENYPFDKYWKIHSSQINIFQPHIHNLIVQRLSTTENQTFITDLKSSLVKGQQAITNYPRKLSK
mgnify:CR=1 FL=1